MTDSVVTSRKNKKLPEGFTRQPKRGDVAVFRHPKNDLVMIKRVVGLPGDRIKVVQGLLYIDGKEVGRTETNNYLYREHKGRVVGVNVYREKLPTQEDTHLIYEMTWEIIAIIRRIVVLLMDQGLCRKITSWAVRTSSCFLSKNALLRRGYVVPLGASPVSFRQNRDAVC